MKQISIVGFGRFGQTLYRMMKDDFQIVIYNRSGVDVSEHDLSDNTKIAESPKEIYASDVIFYAVTISQFENVIADHKQYFEARHLLIDALSVKLYPAKILKKLLAGSDVRALLTHPMFGPDSSKEGFVGLPIVLDSFTAQSDEYSFWKDYFSHKGLRIIEMEADEHDRLAANSQGLTHFVGRLLDEYGIHPTTIDTLGAQKLIEIKDQTTSDTWQLFNDLQHFNPYTRKMRLRLGDAYDKVYNKLLPAQINPERLTIGIQGGKGSFNEEAVMYWLQRSGIKDYEIKYLYTSENVLYALHAGDIDRGQFAIHNSVGGIVDESVEAMARYKFQIIEEFGIKIAHALMIHPEVTLNDVTTIMSHPQVFAQCKTSLQQKYPTLKQTSGKGELVDHAVVAKQLALGKLPKTTATMGSKILAKIYGLKIVEDNLQDAQENFTSFLIISR